jgi:hypothetical protein
MLSRRFMWISVGARQAVNAEVKQRCRSSDKTVPEHYFDVGHALKLAAENVSPRVEPRHRENGDQAGQLRAHRRRLILAVERDHEDASETGGHRNVFHILNSLAVDRIGKNAGPKRICLVDDHHEGQGHHCDSVSVQNEAD